MARFLNWLLTDMGKNVSAVFGITTTVGVFTAHLFPNSLLLHKYKEIVQMYEAGNTKKVNDELLTRAYRVLQEVDIHKSYKDPSIISFFHIPSFDTFLAGATNLSQGAIIGLPMNFTYHDVDDVNTKSIVLYRDQPVSWSSDHGRAFKDTLVLSEAAQKAAIAREIYAADTSRILFRTMLAGFCSLFIFVGGRYINMKYNLYARPRVLRIALYTGMCITSGLMYCGIADSMAVFYEKSSDRKVAKLGKDYIVGSIELYGKHLRRNQLLQEMLGDTGKSFFTLYGNKNTWFRTKSVPLTERLDFFKIQLKKLEEAEQNSE